MRTLARHLLVTAVLSAALATAGAAGRPDPAAAEGETGRLRTVVVAVRDAAETTPDPPESSRAEPGDDDRAARLHAVVRRLRATARQSQAALRGRLDEWQAQGLVADIRPLWISNSITVTATPAVIDLIAARADVLGVRPDRITLVPALPPGTANQVAIRAPELWALGDTGQGTVVATLDSGVDVSHPDLAAGWRGGDNSWFDPYAQHPAAPIDLTGHGTGVTGVLVGGGDSGQTLGTAPGASWIAARVFGDAGASSVTAVHQAFQWLLDPDGDPQSPDAPDVVNASWSIGTAPGCDLVFQPDVQALAAAGIVTVFAAGNFGPAASSDVSPANYPESLSVGAVDGTGISPMSGRGPSGCGGRTRPYPDVVAPGVDVLTTDRWGLYQQLSGTSVAAPHAAGTLALVLAAHPGLTPGQQRDLIASTAVDLGDPGPDETYGHGLVDVVAAHAAAPPPAGFELSAAPSSATVVAGTGTTYQVRVTPSGGFGDAVGLSVYGLPSGSTASLDPSMLSGGSGDAVLTVTTTPGTPVGTVTLTVQAVGGGVVRQADVTLVVTPAPQPERLVLSTLGNVNPPGVNGTADDADLYSWDGTTYARDFDATAAGVPSAANLDGFDRVDATHFYASFAADTRLPGIGKVQDEDVVRFDAGTWSVWFDGTAHGLTAAGAEPDAISVAGATLAFSTLGTVNPPGVTGTADDADVYTWDGTTFTRAWTAGAYGVPKSANVDGLVLTDGLPRYLSFATDTTTLPGLGAVQDEDVVGLDAGTWSVWFDGTTHGLGGSSGLDVDAFDLLP